MKNWRKVILGVALSFMVFFTAIGYAALTDNLAINGTLSATAPEDIFFADISGPIEDSGHGVTASISGLRQITVSNGTNSAAEATFAITIRNNSGASQVCTSWSVSDPDSSIVKNYTLTGEPLVENELATVTNSGTYYSGANALAVDNQEQVTLYVTVSLPAGATDVNISYAFSEFIYSISYINKGEELDARYVLDYTKTVNTANSIAQKKVEEQMGTGVTFVGWMNSGNSKIETVSYSKEEDVEDVTLYPMFDNLYTAMFVDQDGSLLAWCFFNNTPESEYYYENTVEQAREKAETELVKILDTLEYKFEVDYWIVRYVVEDEQKKEQYTLDKFANYTWDVTIYPHYKYLGADLDPNDSGNDGDVDHYEVTGYPENSEGTTLVVIPSNVNGAPVTIISANAFSSFDDLHAVVIPETITEINNNAFSAISGLSRDTITMYYDGDKDTFRDYMDYFYINLCTGNTRNDYMTANGVNETQAEGTIFKSDWDSGMGYGSRIFFLKDGKVDESAGYWELYANKTTIIFTTYSRFRWVYHNHPYVASHPADCSSLVCDTAFTDYDGTCDCNSCNGGNRPDIDYWTWIVTYNYNDGVTESTSVNVVYDQSTTLPTPSRDGYTFAGWYTGAEMGTKVGNAGDPYTPEADITLYARWERIT